MLLAGTAREISSGFRTWTGKGKKAMRKTKGPVNTVGLAWRVYNLEAGLSCPSLGLGWEFVQQLSFLMEN